MQPSDAFPYTLHDRWLRLIGIPAASFLIPTARHFDDFLQLNAAYGQYIVVSVCTTVALWEGNRYIIQSMRRRYPSFSQTTKRLLSEGILALLYTFVTTYLLDEVPARIRE